MIFPREKEIEAASKLGFGILYAITMCSALLFVLGLIVMVSAKADIRVFLFEYCALWFTILGFGAIHKKETMKDD